MGYLEMTRFEFSTSLEQYMSKTVRTVIILVTIIQLFVADGLMLPAFAQGVEDATGSGVVTQVAQLAGIDSASDSASKLPDVPVPVSDNSLLTDFHSSFQAAASAMTRGKILMRSLFKKGFRLQEKIQLVVENADPKHTYETVVTGPNGKKAPVTISQQKDANMISVTLSAPLQLKPGKYTARITDTTTQQGWTQDFTWGVLAINPNKAVYHTGETADIAMAVLDDAGEMVCDAQLNLEIRPPAGGSNLETRKFTTDDGSILVNNVCASKDLTLTPDFEVRYPVNEQGTYMLNLSATTKNGTYTVSDSFQVDNTVPFVIERKEATRIYPAHTYPVDISLTAQDNFTGTVTEIVPESFEVTVASGSGQVYDSVSLVDEDVQPSRKVLGTTTQIDMPFTGIHPITEGFGDEETDPALREKYQTFHVAGHDGIDFDMAVGTAVQAVDGGVVVMAEEDGDYGTTMVVQHGWGKSYYGHLSAMMKEVGQKVERGDTIALSGDTGLETGPHLHFGVKPNDNNPKNGYYGKIDPRPLLGISQVTEVLGADAISDNRAKQISWNISVKKGQTVHLFYAYKAPYLSPEFYTTGPLKLFKNNDFVYSEGRSWQIASDATAGPKFAGTAAATGGGTAWGTTANATGSTTGTYSSVSIAKGGASNYLQLTNFGFTTTDIPTGSTIDGIQVAIRRSEGNASTRAGIVDSEIKIVKGGTIGGSSNTNKAATATNWPTTDAVANYGTSSDVWGESWNVSDVTASNFGVAILASNVTVSGGGGSETARIDTVSITITYTPPAPNLTQIHSRWRNDDGSETTATWRRAEDVSATANINGIRRIRIEVSNEGAANATGTTYRLEYGLLSTTCGAIGSWTQVPASSGTVFEMYPSSGLTDASATTNIASGLTDENTTFVAGSQQESSSQTAGISLSTTQFTEIEYALKVVGGSTNDQYCFRLTNASSTTNFTYTVYPQITIGEPTVEQEHYRWRNDDAGEGVTSQSLYFSPTGAGFATTHTVAAGGCSNWDCVNDNASNATTSVSVPTRDSATTALTLQNGKDYYTLTDDALPTGSTVTGLIVSVWAIDTNNPNNTLTMGYCTTCDGSNDVMGSGSPVGTASYIEYTQSFSSLSLTTTDLNNMQLVVSGSRSGNADISTVYVQVTYSTTGATWRQNEDTVDSNTTLTNMRLRVEVANTGLVSANRNLKLEYAAKSTTCSGVVSWTAMPTSGTANPFVMVDSSYFADGDATTTQLTATGTFVAGKMVEPTSNSTGAITIGASQYTEAEFSIQANSSASGTYCLRVSDNGTDLDVYSVYPEVTLSSSGPTLSQLMRHGKWFNSSGAKQPFTF